MYRTSDSIVEICITCGNDDMDEKLKNSISENLATNKKLADPANWAISYKQLIKLRNEAEELFGEDFKSVTMRDISAKILEPLCRKNGKSYALSKNKNGLETEVFVSHSWDEDFEPFVNCICKTYGECMNKPNLWICAFALRQGNTEEIKTQLGTGEMKLDQSPFVRALQASNDYLIVRNSNKDLCSRMWCICEFYYANQLELIPDKTHITGPDTFADSKTSCEEAESFDPNDREKIMAELRKENSVAQIDELLKQFRGFGTSNKIGSEVTTSETYYDVSDDSESLTTTSEDTSDKKKITPTTKSEQMTFIECLRQSHDACIAEKTLSEDQERDAFKIMSSIKTSVETIRCLVPKEDNTSCIKESNNTDEKHGLTNSNFQDNTEGYSGPQKLRYFCRRISPKKYIVENSQEIPQENNLILSYKQKIVALTNEVGSLKVANEKLTKVLIKVKNTVHEGDLT